MTCTMPHLFQGDLVSARKKRRHHSLEENLPNMNIRNFGKEWATDGAQANSSGTATLHLFERCLHRRLHKCCRHHRANLTPVPLSVLKSLHADKLRRRVTSGYSPRLVIALPCSKCSTVHQARVFHSQRPLYITGLSEWWIICADVSLARAAWLWRGVRRWCIVQTAETPGLRPGGREDGTGWGGWHGVGRMARGGEGGTGLGGGMGKART